MDWKDIAGQLIGAGAPTLGSILGGLIPVPGGSLVGQAAGTLLAKAFGTPPTPEAVSQAMTDASGAVALEKIKLAEAEAQAKWPAYAEMAKAQIQADTDKFKASLADIQSARGQTINLAGMRSNIAWGAPAISVLVTGGYFFVIYMLMFKGTAEYSTQVISLLQMLFGALTAAFVQVCNYWLGSTIGSKNKDQTMSDMVRQAGSTISETAKKIM